ncbi:DUF2933 domain-containing protein [Tissierella carlieri]|uniref:DUF2933 domain-containing protein n=1 Tax=Tissierella carlieri TaxID=689904 RepID=A0ABT1SE31_9FIRM|nr:DUF2933 domain-containing protein [Tissierella carlieri]MBU5313491.1 DUF2933 domain-containing protein [Tissierella carlieri]MCQ4924721.1 DUF2933 domain-containing protein [Tissierella carlieri]
MKNDRHEQGHGKHMLLMLLGCLIPIMIIAGLRYFNIGGQFLSKLPIFLMFLICPLMHIFMMKGMMGHGNKSCHGGIDKENNNELKGSDE